VAENGSVLIPETIDGVEFVDGAEKSLSTMPVNREEFNSRRSSTGLGCKSFEHKITGDFVCYIERIVYDPVQARIRIEFVKSAEDGNVDRVLEFASIQDFREETDEEGVEDSLEALLGLDEYPSPDGTRYVIRTDMRELEFQTSEQPIIQ